VQAEGGGETRPRLLLALDCDGTLLDPEGHITPRVREAVRRAAAAGALVTLATARRLQGARVYAEALGLRTPLVLQDGASVQDPVTGALLHTDPLPPALIQRLIELALEHGLHPVLQRITPDPSGDTIHVLHTVDEDATMVEYLSTRTPVVRGDRTALLAAAPVGRFQAMGTEGPAARFYAHVKERVAELCCLARLSPPLGYASFPHWAVLVTNGGCSKASAVRALAALNGLTLANCVAVGDAENDLEVLTEVRDAGGVSVAMGQAPDEVKAAAGYVVASNAADGVAEAVETLVLPRLLGQAAGEARHARALPENTPFPSGA
jgi:Cof subfamily protein (haloacid dehalogenase superfamily)